MSGIGKNKPALSSPEEILNECPEMSILVFLFFYALLSVKMVISGKIPTLPG